MNVDLLIARKDKRRNGVIAKLEQAVQHAVKAAKA